MNDIDVWFYDKNTLHFSKMEVEQPTRPENAFPQSFSFSCQIAPGSNLGFLTGEKLRTRLRYPRKMKKVLKKLFDGNYTRTTRLMNKLLYSFHESKI